MSKTENRQIHLSKVSVQEFGRKLIKDNQEVFDRLADDQFGLTLIPFAETANDLHELIPADKITKGFTSKGVVEVCIDRAFTHVFGNNPYPDIFTQAAIGLSLFDNDEHRKNEKDSVGRDIDQNYDTIPKEGA